MLTLLELNCQEEIFLKVDNIIQFFGKINKRFLILSLRSMFFIFLFIK